MVEIAAAKILELEKEVIRLQVSEARLSLSVEHLAGAVDKLTTTVQDLRDTMNKGRGALWAVSAAAASLGALVTFAAGKFVSGG